MAELEIPKDLTPEEENRIKSEFNQDIAHKRENPGKKTIPQANA